MRTVKTRPVVLEKMESILEMVIVVIVGIMVANIAAGVFFRYVLQNSLFWTEELGRYLMVWAGYLGAVLAMREDGHVGITAVVSALPPAGRRIANTFAKLIVLAFLLVIVVMSFTHLKTLTIQRSSAMEIPMIIPYLSVTVGTMLMAVETIFLLAGYPAVTEPGVETK